MTLLDRAIDAANSRKEAVLGDDCDGLVFSGSDTGDRAVFSGFDLDYEQLMAFARQVGRVFTHGMLSGEIGPRPLFSAAWLDGLLVGLFAGSLPSTPTGPDHDGAGPEGG